MNQEAEPPQGRFSLEPRDEIVRQFDPFQRLAEDKFAGMEDERLVIGDA